MKTYEGGVGHTVSHRETPGKGNPQPRDPGQFPELVINNSGNDRSHVRPPGKGRGSQKGILAPSDQSSECGHSGKAT